VQVTLLYTESSITYSKTFELLSLKGMDEPDSLRRNAVIHEYLSGGIEEQVDGFFKDPITLTFQAVTTQLSRRFLVQWFSASAKRVIYGAYIAEGITDDALVSEWLYECEHNRSFEVKLWDEHKYYDFQDAGAIADTDMYCKLNVKITGTSDSPQTFTTGTSPLANPTEAGSNWPLFSSITHVANVILQPNTSCQFIPCRVGNPTITGGNVQFQAFVSDMQVPASDGFYYMDVTILLQAKP
jgi:hypothetical protein